MNDANVIVDDGYYNNVMMVMDGRVTTTTAVVCAPYVQRINTGTAVVLKEEQWKWQ
jgi:hypothetical protein